eukprot:CAMPEP_0196589814 /NCGR_PEP_ID=MMETSP1081-20130531/64682_1 /TAXON_ID=36882 /ORGANISM="Pyramimonas amylifera, Strain CCMP720" /LENGTH=520 /DNA_ID=CAMNT_0041912721 /DNA_START=184 /DNA_END=1746 /DNA_ORIENTATION=+
MVAQCSGYATQGRTPTYVSKNKVAGIQKISTGLYVLPTNKNLGIISLCQQRSSNKLRFVSLVRCASESSKRPHLANIREAEKIARDTKLEGWWSKIPASVQYQAATFGLMTIAAAVGVWVLVSFVRPFAPTYSLAEQQAPTEVASSWTSPQNSESSPRLQDQNIGVSSFSNDSKPGDYWRNGALYSRCSREPEYFFRGTSLPKTYSVRSFPDVMGHVMDASQVITPEDALAIQRLGERLWMQTKSELVVVTVDHRASDTEDPKEFATKLFNSWRLGDPQKNNGLLILLVSGERRLEVEVGSGLNLAYRASGRAIQEEVMVPKLKGNDASTALRLGAEAYADFVLGSDQVLAETVSNWSLFACLPAAYMAFKGWSTTNEEKENLKEAFGKDAKGATLVRPAKLEELSAMQAVETKLRSVKHSLWLSAGGDTAVIGKPQAFSPYSKCRVCGAYANRSGNEIIQHPTYYHTGLRRRWKICLHCNAYQGYEELIPILTASSNSNSGSGSGGGGSSDGGGSGSSY